MAQAGFEPATLGLWVPCSNHWATKPYTNKYYHLNRLESTQFLFFQCHEKKSFFTSTFYICETISSTIFLSGMSEIKYKNSRIILNRVFYRSTKELNICLLFGKMFCDFQGFLYPQLLD